MAERLHVLWHRIKRPLAVSIIPMFLVGLVVVIVLGYINNWPWTGLSPKAHSFQGKTLWDWLQILIIPAVLAVGGYLFNLTVSRNERQAAAK
jgi:ABC-type dipeptide/oligopeptide/nickel transport system permease component